ncbi:hypothetical protein ACFXPA_34910 [Amycolatopsis sp. NPDC059090]|uniref:hypothetical protein n=1 Tax=Amycolatopsis sp. NPDC059090 TaxID=3346723 RepID=UPI00366CAAC8
MHRCAQQSPRVEHVHELLPAAQPAQGQGAPVEQVGVLAVLPVGAADPAAVGELELVQMRSVPAGERVVDRGGQLRERVRAGGGEDPARTRPQLAAAADEIHAH